MDTGDRKFIGCSQDVFSPHGQDDFCTRDNWQTAVLYLAQELEGFGLSSPCIKAEGEQSQASLDVITLVNSSWKLVQMYRSCQGRLQDMEAATRASACERDRLYTASTRLREELEQRDRAIAETKEQGRQASEMVDTGNIKLKAAKDEIRKLMSVLLQREAKYNHEIRRSEQETAKLKERLIKVLMEKGEGRGVGVNVLTMTGTVPGTRNGRAHWQTEQTGARREEELFKKVIEEMTKREAAAAEINLTVETALNELCSTVRDSLIHLEVDPHNKIGIGDELCTRPEILHNQTRELADMLRMNIFKLKKPSESYLCYEKLALYEEKIALYEQMIVNFESSKEKQDWILQEFKNLQKMNKDSLLQEKCRILESKEKIDRMKSELEVKCKNFENLKSKFIKNQHSITDSEDSPSPFVLPPGPELRESLVPCWAIGPVQITPSASMRESVRHSGDGTQILGSTARPSSRPGSQPGSRAQSVHRERLEKGKSPAAHLINKRAGGGGARMIETYTASLGRKARPKSQTISPSRGNVINRRSANISRSPSRSKEPQASRSSLSLPRHTNQLNLNKTKRNSGSWSKPPTPGALSPATSDSEPSCLGYR